MPPTLKRSPAAGVRGLTLIELVVGLALAAVVLVSIYAVIATTMRSFIMTEDLLDVQQAARGVLDRVTEEMRWAEAVLPDMRCRPALLCVDRVTLRIPANNPLQSGADYDVAFRHDPRAQVVVRQQDRRTESLGDAITRVEFRYFTAGGAEATNPEDVARIQMAITVTRTASGREQQRTLQTLVLLRNVHPPAAAVPEEPVPLETPFAPRPQPRSPSTPSPVPSSGPGPSIPAAGQPSPVQPDQSPTPGSAAGPSPTPPAGVPTNQVLCPPGPALPEAAPPARRNVRNAMVQVSDWDFDWGKDRTLFIDGEVDNLEAQDVSRVRISATAFAWNGTVVGTAATTVSEIAEDDFEDFELRLPVSQPPVWVRFRVEQYIPRTSAPMHEVVAEVPLSLYVDDAKERVQVTGVALPATPNTRHTVCLAVTDLGGLPVESVRVKAQVTAPGRPVVVQTLDVPSGEAGVSFPVTWPARVLPTVTVTVEGVRLRPPPRPRQ